MSSALLLAVAPISSSASVDAFGNPGAHRSNSKAGFRSQPNQRAAGYQPTFQSNFANGNVVWSSLQQEVMMLLTVLLSMNPIVHMLSTDNQVAHGFHEAGQITIGQASLDILKGQ